MSDSKTKVLVIVGATASGKTSLSIKLAQVFSGEVISVDSRQVYKTLNIGTGKVTPEEMQGIPHHLLDLVDPNETYSAARFAEDAHQAIEEIIVRKHLPIIAGGTFFYIDTLLGKIPTPEVPPNPPLRQRLEMLPVEVLYAQLKEKDPSRAAYMDPHNKRRIIRALEIVSALGSVPHLPRAEKYSTLTIGIHREKEELRMRYKKRAQQWLQQGFLEEIANLLRAQVSEERLREIGFEYRLGIDLYTQRITEDEFIQKFIEKNWQYAKQQLKWLKRDSSIAWYTPDDYEAIVAAVQRFLSET